MKNSILISLMTLLMTSCAFMPKSTYLEKVNNLAADKTPVGGIVRLTSVEGVFICSGFVVNNTTVITANHCAEYLMSVSLNVINVSNGTTSTLGQFTSMNGRLDLASIKGDFSKFSKMSIASNPEEDALANKEDVELVTCGYPYGGKPVCFKLTNLVKYVDFVAAEGQMNAGMSGGPVIDLRTGKVMGINVAVGQGFVLFSPTLNIFDALGLGL